jgi:hypothetical protein
MFKKWLIVVFRYAPPLLLAVFLVLAIYEKISPWEHAETILSQYPDSFSFLVGSNSQSHYRDGKVYKLKENTYLVVKTDFSESKTVKVGVNSDGEFQVKSSEGGLVTYIIIFILLILITWFSWYGYKVFTHNNRLQVDAAEPRD